MQISLKGAQFTRGFEGFVGHWYADAGGVGTLGEGFTWGSVGFRAWWTKNRPGQVFGPGATMTRDEADACLIQIMNSEYIPSLATFVGHDLPQNQIDGAADMVYNCGAGALGDQWGTALRYGDAHLAAQELAGDRVTAGGRVLAGLERRRASEGRLIEFGDYGIPDATQVISTAPVLHRGEHGSAVVDLQKRLQGLGLYAGALDGVFGWGTDAAVLAFQRAHKLTVDGIVGPQTEAALITA